jgi:hypothetical protein
MKNKYLLLTLFLSCFAFCQNIELITKFDKGDQNTPEFLAQNLIPEYKLVKTSKTDSIYGDEIYYYYLPKTTSDEKVKQYLQNNINSNEVTLSYMVYGVSHKFSKARGKCSVILPFWIKEIKPDTKITEGHRDSFIYENSEKKIKYYLTATETDYINCSFSKIN